VDFFFLLVTSTVGIGHEESQNAPVFRGWRAAAVLQSARTLPPAPADDETTDRTCSAVPSGDQGGQNSRFAEIF
jgi:hypothetical protein